MMGHMEVRMHEPLQADGVAKYNRIHTKCSTQRRLRIRSGKSISSPSGDMLLNVCWEGDRDVAGATTNRISLECLEFITALTKPGRS